MTGPAPVETTAEDTQPTRPVRSSLGRWKWPAWAVTAAFSLVLLTVAALLILPPLLAPAPGPGPGYDVVALGEVRATMMPGDDTLLVTPDGIVAVYVPMGAYPQAGELLVKSRDLALTPNRVEDELERFYPVDVFIESSDGATLTQVDFEAPILICYLLEPTLLAAVADHPEAIRIQVYAENGSLSAWETLPGSPGWLDNQVCSNVDHLSLFALAIHRSVLVGGAGPKEVPTTTPSSLPVYLPPGLP